MVWVRVQPRRLPVQVSRASWAFLGVGLLALLLGAAAGPGRVSSGLMLVLLGACSVVVSFLLRRRAERSLADVSDAQFLEQLGPPTDLPEDLLLRERRHVSRILGVNPRKLSAQQRLSELSRNLDFVGSFSVAVNDLQYELNEFYEDARLKPPAAAETVGDLVIQFARAKHRPAPARLS